MARLNSRALTTTPPPRRRSPSPTADSDKENSGRKRKRSSMEDSHEISSQRRRSTRQEERVDKEYYDPDQDENERRATYRRLREIGKNLYDSRSDYLKASSDGLVQTLDDLSTILPKIKQTSTATIDSRILLNVADISQKKITDLTLGDSNIGVDVDDFVSKCIAFMKKGGQSARGVPTGSTQTQRRRGRNDVDDDEDDTGEALDWDYLGRNACFLYNSRPCLTGFLLGPLSLQKKVRQQTQRRARERANPADALRPIALGDEDLELQESANLTEICTEIASILSKVQAEGQAAADEAYDESMEPDEFQAMLRSHCVADDGLVPLFDFCVNPQSFGQTVENVFYISFLIKEGAVGLGFDSRGLPTLGRSNQKSVGERQEAARNQAVLKLDFETWEGIIKQFGIKQSIIPHRDEVEYDDGTNVEQGQGWYG